MIRNMGENLLSALHYAFRSKLIEDSFINMNPIESTEKSNTICCNYNYYKLVEC
jgi:hypothetical protein